MEAIQPPPPTRACAHCATENPDSARFCKSCGASLRPPPQCPSCGADTATDAKFCAHCGAGLVGPRPKPALVEAPKDKPALVEAAKESDPPSGETDDDAIIAAASPESDLARLQAEAASLPAPRPPSSNILSNVLMFVAFLLVMVVVIYKMNQGAPKVVSPFQGGPAPSAQPAAAPPPSTDTAVDPSLAVKGQVVLADGISSGGGTLFVILRLEGVTRGPPVAVRKFASPTFPQSFSVTSANTMLKGMPFAGPFDIQVRLDQDGNAMTKSAGDLVATSPAKGIKPGDPAVVITLDKRL